MKRGNRLASARLSLAALLVVGTTAALGAVGASGCGSILGIDDGIPFPDATSDVATGDDVSSSGSDVTVADTASPETGNDGDDAGDDVAVVGDVVVDDVPQQDSPDGTAAGDDASDAADGPGSDARAEGCSPDLTFCQNRCKPGTDSCGVFWNCTGSCAPGEGCTPDGRCLCVADPHWCDNRCGRSTDNCGNAVMCPGCSGGATCTNGACGCVPESNSQACGSKQCGSVMNNCTQTVSCGVNGTALCGAGQTCTSSDTCCTLATCAGRCNTSISDNCGGSLSCPANSCSAGEVCYQTNCCTPVNNCGNQCGVSVSNNCGGSVSCSCSSGVCYQGACCTPNGTCSGNCVDNCGQQSSACCDAGMPMDAGGMCGATPFPCNGPSDPRCCSPHTCVAGIIPLSVVHRALHWFGAGGGGDGGVMPPPDGGTIGYTCQ